MLEKTAIINQFINNFFDEQFIIKTPNDKPIKELELINGKKISLEIWDTAGAEQYKQ